MNTNPLILIHETVVHHLTKLKKTPEDIIQELERKFNSDAKQALNLINIYRNKYEYMDSDRVTRCVIHLSNGDLESLEHYLELGKTDPRDVMLWAEYEKTNGWNPKRVRDFDKTFGQNKFNQ
ncbi:hypothetical protein [Croceivirga thetidis]|uniref:Uncharacterized protein n=1 Tax=Croceivirga thetidis TaxID=2721623 RepID=A0ABX1GKJ7_9FLAO|nr:hypothetical protein [Croceivirga thetidis]NKI30428.1 hypothetical protein [Croceivirga thetidis]